MVSSDSVEGYIPDLALFISNTPYVVKRRDATFITVRDALPPINVGSIGHVDHSINSITEVIRGVFKCTNNTTSSVASLPKQ